jgi:hypothetical protein
MSWKIDSPNQNANYPVAAATFNSTTFAAIQTFLKNSSLSPGVVTSVLGYDIVFASDSLCSTIIPFERVVYSTTTGASEFHYLASSVNATVYLCAGNAAITTDQSNPNGTWPSQFKFVQHMPNGTVLSANDSTSNGNNANVISSLPGAGLMGGDVFIGNTNYIQWPSSSTLDSTTATWSCWIRSSTSGTFPSVFFSRMDSSSFGAFFILNTTGGLAFISNQGNNGVGTSLTIYADGNWHYVAGDMDSGGVNMAITADAGTDTNSATGQAVITLAGRVVRAGFPPDGFWTLYNGDVEECRMTGGAKTPSTWKADDYNSQKPSNSWLTITAVSATSTVSNQSVIQVQ